MCARSVARVSVARSCDSGFAAAGAAAAAAAAAAVAPPEPPSCETVNRQPQLHSAFAALHRAAAVNLLPWHASCRESDQGNKASH